MFLILTVEEVDWASYSDTVHLSRAAHTLCQKKKIWRCSFECSKRRQTRARCVETSSIFNKEAFWQNPKQPILLLCKHLSAEIHLETSFRTFIKKKKKVSGTSHVWIRNSHKSGQCAALLPPTSDFPLSRRRRRRCYFWILRSSSFTASHQLPVSVLSVMMMMMMMMHIMHEPCGEALAEWILHSCVCFLFCGCWIFKPSVNVHRCC